MIDDLLQLGKLEEYRERASSARVGVGRVRDDKQGALAQIDEQIEAKADKDLAERLNVVETELSAVAEEIERYEDNRESAVETLDEAESILSEYEEKREELSTLETEISDLQEAVAEGERTRESLAEEISDYRERIDEHEADAEAALAETELPTDVDRETVEQRLSELDERDDELGEEIQDHRLAAQKADSEAESHRTEAQRLDEQAEQKRERADELEADIEATEETLARAPGETLSELDEEMERLRDRLCRRPPVDVGGSWSSSHESGERWRTGGGLSGVPREQSRNGKRGRCRRRGEC
ncbi:hypothetical protein [Halapricum sp. CBA1109]|uniref:hypothetical protein n=1 Tax=Halapricum sp. CBA1109 TaxID=2668068 RepID=UPI001E5C9708|nr:hypothetical protein [Halapricum sp. CBA1109]